MLREIKKSFVLFGFCAKDSLAQKNEEEMWRLTISGQIRENDTFRSLDEPEIVRHMSLSN